MKMKMQNAHLSAVKLMLLKAIGSESRDGWNKMIHTHLSVPAEGFSTLFCSWWEHDREFLNKSGRKRIAKRGDLKEVQRLKFGFFDIAKG